MRAVAVLLSLCGAADAGRNARPLLSAAQAHHYRVFSSAPTTAAPAATATATFTATLPTNTMSMTRTITGTVSLPTMTTTVTMPTATVSTTRTTTLTATLPTITSTTTATATSVMTGTTTHTTTRTMTSTKSIAATVSRTISTTRSATATRTTTVSRSASMTTTRTSTVTLPTQTATMTLPTTTYTGARTSTVTATLPTGTFSGTTTKTMTATLPSGTVSATSTMTLPTSDATETSTITMPTSTLSGTTTVTSTMTMPTDTVTMTMPTSTTTATISFPTMSWTATLPTTTVERTTTLPTLSATATMTLPTGTATATGAAPSVSPTTSPTTSAPTVSPSTSAPTVSPSTPSPTANPTLSPTAPTVSPTTAPPTAPPTTSPTTSPTSSAPTLSPTFPVGPTAFPTTLPPVAAPAPLTPAQLNTPAVSAAFSTPAVQVSTTVVVSTFVIGTVQTGPVIPGLPIVSFTPRRRPQFTRRRGRLSILMRIRVSFTVIINNVAAYKASFQITIAIKLRRNPRQIRRIYFRRLSTGLLLGHGAQPLDVQAAALGRHAQTLQDEDVDSGYDVCDDEQCTETSEGVVMATLSPAVQSQAAVAALLSITPSAVTLADATNAFQANVVITSPTVTGVPTLTFRVTTAPSTKTVTDRPAGTLGFTMTVNANFTEWQQDPSLYKLAYVLAVATSMNRNPYQFVGVLFTGPGSVVLDRHAHELQDSISIDTEVCPNNCGATSTGIQQPTADDDDGFPGWAIALCVILPLLAIVIPVAIYFACCGTSQAATEEKAPYGTEQEPGIAPGAEQV
eukprot:TRINITY_DN35410_c0_g1_i1.p1 TRINITY_DN35410_c0_g1~~TRINITY_DN35410_c0_g1_i1.p1  ORF type:complete len:796 (+),score=115.90 TRINITY_DN35410_c0_g1_i1:80-2467(+)